MIPPFPALVARLWCLHWPGGGLPATSVAGLRSSGVFLSTCLRQLAFGLAPRPGPAAAGTTGELRTGRAAYQLLLEVASGLRSAVPGETNVSGQFRRACEQAAAGLDPAAWRRLQPLVLAVQADTRALRVRHLQGLAGTSYGSLVRALLAPPRNARVLFVGTGDLARSMLPLFQAFEVGAWNHRPGAPLAEACRQFAPADADAAADWASDLVFTTPRDPDHDAAWHDRLSRRAVRGLVHLGLRRSDRLAWPSVAASFDLDDVFDLASARDQHRSQKLRDAALAGAALVDARLGGERPVRTPAAQDLARA